MLIANNINTRQSIIIIKKFLSEKLKPKHQNRNNKNIVYNLQMDQAILS